MNAERLTTKSRDVITGAVADAGRRGQLVVGRQLHMHDGVDQQPGGGHRAQRKVDDPLRAGGLPDPGHLTTSVPCMFEW